MVILDLLNWFENHGDPRVGDWVLMSSPLPTVLICLSYVLIVKKFGPEWMESRKAFDLRQTLVFYNGFQVLFSAWLFYEYGRGGWFHGYSFTCQPVDYSNSEMGIRMTHACWWYYFSKYTEFFDTFFFILRKKNNQVSTLHVIHHGLMPLSVWFGVKLTPGGHSTFFGLLNTLVHVIMYTYYMLAAMGPKWAKFLWWKKYLTGMQMVQFILIATHAFQLLFTSCNYPRAFVWWIGSHGILFLILFSNFYTKSYKTESSKLYDAVSSTVGVCGMNNNKDNKMDAEGVWGRGVGVEKRDPYKGH